MMILFALAAAACSLSLPAQTASTPPTATAVVIATTPAIPPTLTFTAVPPTLTLTGTPTPYPTITPIPTITITPTVTQLGENRITPTPSYDCELVEKFPDQWAPYKPRTEFQARWMLKNTGTLPWEFGYVTLRYISGVKMHGSIDKREVPVETLPGQTYRATVHMVSPKAKGDYATTWGLVARGGNIICAFTAKIIVE